MDGHTLNKKPRLEDASQETKTPTAVTEFQEILRTRTEWKNELNRSINQRRLEMVEQIEANRLTHIEESKYKLFRLPDQVWEIILFFIENPRDLKSIWEVHPKFRDLSDVSKTQECLLSQVLMIENLPRLWEWNSKKIENYKIFRTLSKGMRNAVDRCLEDDFMKVLRGKGKLTLHSYISYGGLDALRRFRAKFCSGSVDARVKRVPHRSLKLYLDVLGGHFGDSNGEITPILEIMGHQIWHLNFTFCASYDNLESHRISINRIYLGILHWISLMPNLKWFEVKFHYNSGPQKAMITQDIFENYPFPHLKYLERLTVNNFHGFAQKYDILTSIIRSNPQIKILETKPKGDYVGDRDDDMDLLDSLEMKTVLSLLNVEHYAISCRRYQRPTFSLASMQPIAGMNWNLKFLELHLETPTLGSIFHFVNNFLTLQHLCLDIADFNHEDNLQYLDLPNLTDFDFTFTQRDRRIDFSQASNILSLYSLQFLVPCKMLRNLKWENGFFCSSKMPWKLRRFLKNHECSDIMPNFRGGYRPLKHSNIWQVFPDLETVEIGGVFNRRMMRRPKLLF